MTDALNTLAMEYDMLPRGGTVLCAVSGGADSVYLLHRLWLLRDILGFNLTAFVVRSPTGTRPLSGTLWPNGAVPSALTAPTVSAPCPPWNWW